jgi:hypothetical protein
MTPGLSDRGLHDTEAASSILIPDSGLSSFGLLGQDLLVTAGFDTPYVISKSRRNGGNFLSEQYHDKSCRIDAPIAVPCYVSRLRPKRKLAVMICLLVTCVAPT